VVEVDINESEYAMAVTEVLDEVVVGVAMGPIVVLLEAPLILAVLVSVLRSEENIGSLLGDLSTGEGN
jgi:hypothetical protein